MPRPAIFAVVTAAVAVPAVALPEAIVITETQFEDNVGKYFVFNDHAGAVAACAQLRAGLVPRTLVADFPGKGSVQLRVNTDPAKDLAVSYNVAGLDAECSGQTACSYTIREGSSCDALGDAFFGPALELDPWKATKWANSLSEAVGTFEVKTGKDTIADMAGKPFVVHDKTGARVACAMLAKKDGADAAESLTTAAFVKYPGYTGDLVVSGTAEVSFSESGTGVTYSLAGVDQLCTSAAAGVLNSCGVHVHQGTSCEAAEDIQGHFYDSEALTADPWAPITYSSKSSAVVGELALDEEAYVVGAQTTLAENAGKVIKFFDGASSFSSCGVLKNSGDGMLSATVAKLPEYQGTNVLQGQVWVKEYAGKPGYLQLDFDLTPTGDAAFCGRFVHGVGKCTFSIHTGTECVSGAGPNFFKGDTEDDPWMRTAYVMDRWAAAKDVSVTTGKAFSENKGRAFVVHDATGARVACATLREKDATHLVAEDFTKYPGYGGALTVTGEVRVSAESETSTTIMVDYALQGVDSTCDLTWKDKANACGVHIHTGLSCKAEEVGGHFFSGSEDPWAHITYVASGNRVVTLPQAFASRQAWAPLTSTTSTVTTTTISSTSTTTQEPQEVRVDILGKSGKFTVWDPKRGKDLGVTVEMDSLKELDGEGNEVGTSGSVKHSINTFAAQDFTIQDPQMVEMNNIQVNKVSFASSVSSIGNIQVDTYIVAQDHGQVGPPGELFAVKQGDFKWNIELSGWKFCGSEGAECKKGQTVEVGSFIDFQIKVKSKTDATDAGKGAAGTPKINLGDGMELQLSNKVQVDGEWQDMAEGFPKVDVQGSSTILTFRFPKFTNKAMYDPVITGVQEQVTSTTTTTPGQTSSTTSTTMTMEPLEVKVDVKGQSGKFTAYDSKKGQDSGISVEMDALTEVDAAGKAVGATGSTKHSINGFASQEFTIADAVMEDMDGVSVNRITFDSTVSDGVGKVKVDTYVIGQDGSVGPPDEKVAVKKGDFKWNVALSDWKFCGTEGNACAKDEVGDAVDLTVTLKGAFDSAKAEGQKVVLKDGLNLQLSRKVRVDNVWQDMAEGYPKVEAQGSKVSLTFRFPKFTKEALYDPIVTGMVEAAGGGGGGGGGGDPTDPAKKTGSGMGAGGIIAIVVVILALLAGGVLWFTRSSGAAAARGGEDGAQLRDMDLGQVA